MYVTSTREWLGAFSTSGRGFAAALLLPPVVVLCCAAAAAALFSASSWAACSCRFFHSWRVMGVFSAKRPPGSDDDDSVGVFVKVWVDVDRPLKGHRQRGAPRRDKVLGRRFNEFLRNILT